jgi:hypothetical protein
VHDPPRFIADAPPTTGGFHSALHSRPQLLDKSSKSCEAARPASLDEMIAGRHWEAIFDPDTSLLQIKVEATDEIIARLAAAPL